MIELTSGLYDLYNNGIGQIAIKNGVPLLTFNITDQERQKRTVEME